MKDLVIMHDQQAVTTSLILAEAFDKKHKNVIQAIEAKINTAENSALLKNMLLKIVTQLQTVNKTECTISTVMVSHLLQWVLQDTKQMNSNLNILMLLIKWKSKSKKRHNLDYQQI